MKIFRIILSITTILILAFGGLMFWKATKSHSVVPNIGVDNGRLKDCGPKPNCVSSVADKNSKAFITPIEANNIETLWDNLNILLPDLGIQILTATDKYIHGQATTSLLKFVDDVEFLLDEPNNTIHLRSASRVGYSDMGTNRKRLKAIKRALMAK